MSVAAVVQMLVPVAGPPATGGIYFRRRDCGVNLRGWVAAGFVGNTSDPDSKFNGPYNAVDRSNEPMMNQLYLIGERALPECGWGIGARVDMLYGEDFFLAQSARFRDSIRRWPQRWNREYYGLAFPQVVRKLGKPGPVLPTWPFLLDRRLRRLMAPDNFFYTKSYSYQFAGPFQHWGGQMNWNINEAWSVQLGLVNGWDALGSRERRL